MYNSSLTYFVEEGVFLSFMIKGNKLNIIIGKIKYLHTYKGLSKEIDEAINYVLNTDLLALETGKYVINENITVNRQRYIGKEFEIAAPENHQKFLDLQIVVKGKEGFGYAHVSNPTLRITDEYNAEKDLTKYIVKDECIYEMSEGSFAIVYPEDIHRPGIKIDDNYIEKVVIKIRIV
jgi:YhcH/YjgK/YiaL family protein